MAHAAGRPAYTIADPTLFVYVPSNAELHQPVQVLVAMHGMGGNGKEFCQSLIAAAERNGWIVVAPTFRYQDYMNPALVLQDDLSFLPRLKATLDDLPRRTGVPTRDRVLLYGHSRGAQAVHRFATYYPERTLGVVAMSAGSYTLPLATTVDGTGGTGGRAQQLPLPYGVADLRARLGRDFDAEAFKQVRFQVEVGGQDGNPNETPRAWDPYLGRSRIDRARAYTQALQELGVPAELRVYPEAGHGISAQMHGDALAFLQQVAASAAPALPAAPTYGLGAARGVLASGAVVEAAALSRR
jgi:predicted esterase